MNTCHRTNLIAFISILLLCLRADTLPADQTPDQKNTTSTRLTLTEIDSALTITQGGRNVLVYNKQSPPVPDGIDPTYRRSGFLHPVTSPAGKSAFENNISGMFFFIKDEGVRHDDWEESIPARHNGS